MWGYPEFYIPVPGGYGTEAHGHLLADTAGPRARAHGPAGATGGAGALGSLTGCAEGRSPRPPLRTMTTSPGRRRCRG